MKFYIHNEVLDIGIEKKGAELKRVFRKDKRQEYLWPGDTSSWNRSSPILFPIVGRLKDDKFFYKNREYKLSQHGFARDSYFEIKERTENAITFLLESTANTLKVYPWNFELQVKYELDRNLLKIEHKVTNTSKENMYYSLGIHPAFRWPLHDEEDQSDYSLKFDRENSLQRTFLSDGLQSIRTENVNNLVGSELNLRPDLFENDALVIKDVSSSKIIYCSQKKGGSELEIGWEECPYLGIWSKAQANFICIEPWQGIADTEIGVTDISKKEGIRMLEPGRSGFLRWYLKMK
ncbi:MAG: aldose 1-epimerase family protein [Bacteroidia bacterium]|nr:aldose 1-epimerase family protein [Bacteroidia bacterium]